MPKRKTLSHWQQHLAAAQSGEPLPRYAASQGLSVQRLYAARHALKVRGAAAPPLDCVRASRFVPIRVVATAEPSATVRLPNGIEVVVGTVPSRGLPSMLQLLAGLSCGA
ncbi:MAG: hypothetical protein HYX63_22780 [Gammaproteobacteria bacterium]|nr:hypothetical protein [Gammaproteobacteria bacterium]